jgi:hypothetical protein
MSNKSRLIDAGIVNPEKTLSEEQDEAIESLSEEEVDSLISSREKLAPSISDTDEIFVWPGISGGSQSS